MLTRDQLIRPHTKQVEVDGGSICIRALTAGEAMAYRGKDLGADVIFGLIAASIVEPALSVEDVRALPVAIVNEIVKEVFSFNALGEKAIADAQDELKKTPESASITNSP